MKCWFLIKRKRSASTPSTYRRRARRCCTRRWSRSSCTSWTWAHRTRCTAWPTDTSWCPPWATPRAAPRATSSSSTATPSPSRAPGPTRCVDFLLDDDFLSSNFSVVIVFSLPWALLLFTALDSSHQLRLKQKIPLNKDVSMLRSLIWGRSCNFTGISFLFSIGQGGSVRVRLLVPAAPQRHGVVRVGRSVGLPRRILRRRRGRRSLWPVPPLLGLATGLLALAFLINFMNFISLILHQSKLLISTRLKVFLANKTCFYRQKKTR